MPTSSHYCVVLSKAIGRNEVGNVDYSKFGNLTGSGLRFLCHVSLCINFPYARINIRKPVCNAVGGGGGEA